MAFTSWLQGLKGILGRTDRARRPGSHRRAVTSRRRFVPHCDALEDRTLPSTYTVTNLLDGPAPGPAGSLRAAINSGDNTIAFAKGLHGTITLTSGELLIGNSVTINGPGANQLSVSGNNSSRVFEIAAGLNVTISDLTVTHGSAVYEGGGILNDGSNLTLSGDNLTQNVVYESATDAGAGATDLYAEGGALYSVTGTLTITNCQITGNQARACRPVGVWERVWRRLLGRGRQRHDHGQHDRRQPGPGRQRQPRGGSRARGHHQFCPSASPAAASATT